MTKKRRVKNGELPIFSILILLFCIVVFSGKVFGDNNNEGGVSDEHGQDRTERENNGNHYGNDGNGGEENREGGDEVEVVETSGYEQTEMFTSVTVEPENTVVTVPPFQRVEPTLVPEESRGAERFDSGIQFGQNQRSVEFVPISQKSEVMTGDEELEVVVTKTVVEKIKTKIQQVGRGEIISTPKKIEPTKTITPKKKKDADIEVLSGDVSMLYRIGGNSVFVGVENGEGRTMKVSQNEMRRVEVTTVNKLKKAGINLGITRDNVFVIEKNGVSALIEYPVAIALSNNQIMIKTPYGDKELQLMPDVALAEVLGVGSFIKPSGVVMDLITNEGNLAYKLEGLKEYKLFGYFPVTVKESVHVLADSGEIKRNNQSLVTNAVRLLSVW